MNEIKQYKPLALVFYIDWNGERSVLPLEESKREAFKKAIEMNKMVELEWITINVFDIKEIRPASTLTKLENIYYSMPRPERKFIKERTRRMANKELNDPVEYWSILPFDKAVDRLESMVRYYHEEVLWEK